jgi:hypothetical protein
MAFMREASSSSRLSEDIRRSGLRAKG